MKSRKAFTLIELLCVISIIGILLGITIPAVQKAREAGKRAQVANDINQMSMGIAAAKDTYSARYVPSYARIQSSYDLTPGGPNYATNLEALNTLRDFFGSRFGQRDPKNSNVILSNLPDWGDIYGSQCLVFFLGGYRDAKFNAGFGTDTVNPFVSPAGKFKPNQFFDFQANRLYISPNGGPPVYVDAWSDGRRSLPYFYMTSRNGNDYVDNSRQLNKNGVCWYPAGTYKPFSLPGESFTLPVVRSMVPLTNANGKPFNMNSFQIVSGGKDHLEANGGSWTPGVGQYGINQPGYDDQGNFQSAPLGMQSN